MDKDTRNTLENYKIEPFTLIHDIVVNWWAILLGALAAAMIVKSSAAVMSSAQSLTGYFSYRPRGGAGSSCAMQ